MEETKEFKFVKTEDEANIRGLAAGIIIQACNDYEYILKNGRRGEHRIKESKEHLEDWFLKGCPPYGGYLGIQGSKILEQMKENYAKYKSVRMPSEKKNKKKENLLKKLKEGDK